MTELACKAQASFKKNCSDSLEQFRSIGIVAHSFGSWILLHALLKYFSHASEEELYIDRIILYGSVIDRHFNFYKINKSFGKLRNEVGESDFVAKIPYKLIPNSGISGSHGFATPPPENVINYYHSSYGHSDAATAFHTQQRWIPFLVEKDVLQSSV